MNINQKVFCSDFNKMANKKLSSYKKILSDVLFSYACFKLISYQQYDYHTLIIVVTRYFSHWFNNKCYGKVFTLSSNPDV